MKRDETAYKNWPVASNMNNNNVQDHKIDFDSVLLQDQ